MRGRAQASMQISWYLSFEVGRICDGEDAGGRCGKG